MTSRIRSLRKVRDLVIGDRIRTTAHRWETIVQLDRGDMWSRSTRVFTAESGTCPWQLTNTHVVTVLSAAFRPVGDPTGVRVPALLAA